MLRTPVLLSAALMFSLFGCRSESNSDSSEPDATPETETETETGSDADWSELEDDDGASDKDKGGNKDTGKGGEGGGDCGSEVKAGAACEGTWEETLCQDESGNYWWCENGTWTTK